MKSSSKSEIFFCFKSNFNLKLTFGSCYMFIAYYESSTTYVWRCVSRRIGSRPASVSPPGWWWSRPHRTWMQKLKLNNFNCICKVWAVYDLIRLSKVFLFLNSPFTWLRAMTSTFPASRSRHFGMSKCHIPS